MLRPGNGFALAFLLVLVPFRGLSSPAGQIPKVPQTAEPDAAGMLFERLKGLEGVWEGTSTRGWEARVEYRLIARGSALMGVSEYEAHPGDAMATVYYRDSDEVGLTHYCVAGNQPRLAATEIEASGRRATFTWVGGTGMSSRDEGHMDKVVIEFVGDDEFVSRWTWYQDGEERWLEEIRYRRTDSPDDRTPAGRRP